MPLVTFSGHFFWVTLAQSNVTKVTIYGRRTCIRVPLPAVGSRLLEAMTHEFKAS